MNRKTLILFAAISALAAAETPSAEAILDRHVEVSGGKAAYEKLTSTLTRGRIEFVGTGVSGTLVSIVGPNQSTVTTITLGQLGVIRSGLSDGVAWEHSAVQGARILSGPERDMLLRVAYLDAPVRWRTLFKQVRSAGEDSVEGKPCDKVEMTPATSGKQEMNCYDRATGLLVYSRSNIPNPMGEIDVETRVSDYRKVGPLTLPHRVEQAVGPQKLITSVESITLNAALAPDTFARPREIEALLARKD